MIHNYFSVALGVSILVGHQFLATAGAHADMKDIVN